MAHGVKKIVGYKTFLYAIESDSKTASPSPNSN